MFIKSIAVTGLGLLLAVSGCTHNMGGGNGASYGVPTTTMSDDGMTKEQLQAKGEDEMREGTAVQAKGAADNNSDEMNKGQQMQEDAQKLLDQARTLAPSK